MVIPPPLLKNKKSMLTLIINLQKGKLADRVQLTIISLAIDAALFIPLLK